MAWRVLGQPHQCVSSLGTEVPNNGDMQPKHRLGELA